VSAFDILREQITLDRIVSSNSSGKAHCVAPGHQDNGPSMHVYDDHVHCFSCGFHGDVTDVWTAMHGFGHPIEAALDLARQFGVELPKVEFETRQKAQNRRQKEDLYLRQAHAWHRALEKHPRVRQ
jgi:DNA primase